jgi:hypothetical protein
MICEGLLNKTRQAICVPNERLPGIGHTSSPSCIPCMVPSAGCTLSCESDDTLVMAGVACGASIGCWCELLQLSYHVFSGTTRLWQKKPARTRTQ